ncbi:MAG: DUF5615 family PIN-like protein [Chloroflexota bacterium]
MKFLIDAQLPRRMCSVLFIAGHDAIHTSSLPEANRTPDVEVCRVALEESRVVITKDADFYYSHVLHGRPPRLVLIRTGNIRARDLLELFERQLPAIVAALEQYSLVEVNRSNVQIPPPLL